MLYISIPTAFGLKPNLAYGNSKENPGVFRVDKTAYFNFAFNIDYLYAFILIQAFSPSIFIVE